MPRTHVLPGVDALVAERQAFLETLTSLDRDDLVNGPTLCEGWSPRDVLAHMIGTQEDVQDYVKARGSINGGNARAVARGRETPVETLLDRGRRWADEPSLLHKVWALFALQDTAIHHLDVLQPRGLHRDLPEASAWAVLREGLTLGAPKLLKVRAVPTDADVPRGLPLGRGHQVRGTRAALGMWLAGRDAYAEELEGVPSGS